MDIYCLRHVSSWIFDFLLNNRRLAHVLTFCRAVRLFGCFFVLSAVLFCFVSRPFSVFLFSLALSVSPLFLACLSPFFFLSHFF